MNEPFLLSNLIDLQDIDNEITKLIKKKSEGDTVLELKKLEQKYKEITKAIEISKEAMGDYFNEKKDFDKKLLENKNKLLSIEMKLQDTKLNASELQNYTLQKSNVQVLIEDTFKSIDLLNSNYKDGLIEIERFQNEFTSLKPKLVQISKMLQTEWRDIDSSMSKREQEKSNLISSFPDEIKFFYDELKSQGVEIIAAYKNDTQCGCCGVSLTSSEIDSVQESKFQQCPYCQGVLI